MYVKSEELQKLWSSISESEQQSFLLQHVAKEPTNYIDVCRALLYRALSETGACLGPKNMNQLLAVTNDGWQYCSTYLRYFAFSKFHLLRPLPRRNLISVIEKIVALNGKEVDGLIVGLLRNIRAGDHSSANLNLVESLLNIFQRNRDWLLGQAGVIPFVLYSFGRLCSEDNLPPDASDRIVKLCSDLLHNRYRECIAIGRDFIRVVYAIREKGSMGSFWAWFTSPVDPTDPSSIPMNAVLAMPSQKKYIAARLTPLMETEIIYMMEQVKSGRQSFYEAWYQDAHIPKGPADDPTAMLSDLVRYIVAVYHPSNAILASSVAQRWSILCWLYRLIVSEKAAFELMQAIYFDWFFFNPTIDSIMNVEPGCLVIAKGLGRLPAISIGAITYLQHYRPAFGLYTNSLPCIQTAMRVCVEKGVIPDLNGVLGSPILDEASKHCVRSLFNPSATMSASPMPAPMSTTPPVADPRRPSTRPPSHSAPASMVASPTSTATPIEEDRPEISVEDEIDAESADVLRETGELLKDKLRLLNQGDVPDDVITCLIGELRRIESQLLSDYPARIRPASLKVEHFLASMSEKIRTLARIQGPRIPLLPICCLDFLSLERETKESGKFEMDFADQRILAELQESVNLTSMQQIYVWKSVVLGIEYVPSAQLRHIPQLLRAVFPLIGDDREVLRTGLQDAIRALNVRLRVVPAIFDNLPDLQSEAFQTFVEECILLTRRD